MAVPEHPKIYHIVHADKLPSIITDRHLWCDAEIERRLPKGTAIGMSSIKQRRLQELRLHSHPDLFVGNCVPFYFCPRSVMLYLIHRGNHPELDYRGGQLPIVHLQADMKAAVGWATRHNKRWAFTLGNAGTRYFEDRSDLTCLDEIHWEAIQATRWSGSGISPSIKEGKQAEFLVEHCFPWELVERIGVASPGYMQQVMEATAQSSHTPSVAVIPEWYY